MGAVRPTQAEELAAIIGDAASRGARLELRGGGSKADVGAPVRDAAVIDMTGFAGVIDYDPPELVLTVGAGTPLAEIAALVASEQQMLAFDPFDHGPVFGRPPGAATIGGVIAAGVSGSRRLSAGAVRDHLLGFTGVSGRGERFVAGAKVVKNVTGFDLSKLMCGSWGRLVALTEVTLKVLPRPRETVTRVLLGQTPEQALQSMTAAMRSQAGVAAAAHVPGLLRGGEAQTLLRLEGFGPSITARLAMLDGLSGGICRGETLPETAIWDDLRTLAPLDDGRPLWRISLPVGGCSSLLAALEPHGARFLVDWAGGLVWMTFDGAAALVRDAAVAADGHAMLVRADAVLRADVPALHPQPPALAVLEARVRRSFDPAGVFETGRFGRIPDAD